MNIFGNVLCSHCGLETRFLIETKKENDTILLLGDELKQPVSEKVECDYCQNEFTTHTVIIEGKISAFLNEYEFSLYQNGKKKIKKAEKNAGIIMEKTKKLVQFHETITLEFENQPIKKGDTITINRRKWKVEKVHKKENIEIDATKRLLIQTFDEYWYEVNNKNEKKWIIVQDAKENNAVLTQDMPVLKENEKIYDITDTLHKTTLILERELSDNYQLRAYEMLSGIRVVVHSVIEDVEELEFDVLGETFEEALAQIEDVYAVSE